MSEQRKPCNPDDVICQMEVLRHLKGLEDQLGSEAFLEKYPEAKTLQERISGEVTRQQEVVDQGMAECTEEEVPAAEAEAEEETEE